MEAALSVKGQVTIPKAARDYLGIGPGDRVKFFFNPDGSVVILPKVSVTVLRGIARGRAQGGVSMDETERAIADEASSRHVAEKSR
jgi:AbrB family looped-hinge helix DNA binding protein